MSEQTPCPDYVWWLIPEKLAGMSRPLSEDLPRLYQAGMRGIVSVMDESSGIEEYKNAKFQALWLPTTGGKPPTVEQVKKFVEFAEPLIENNQPVVVHCTSGNRRTGTLLAAYLVAKGEYPERALSLVQKARPTAELRDAQREFLSVLPQLLAKT
ncbi:dual specificity protein phosphatase family protein [Myxosarcina sp. GI1]|uniref:phosphatase domain-containing putative toxin n=1 Tax=Myxosarcina sp. GI1 TaxID=1541065 RepID=UPI00055FCD87|nr:dual specificity protein phosphatase family protein [Myxosarcina sp. GI1]